MLSLSPLLLRQAVMHPVVLGLLAFTALWLALRLAGVAYLADLVALGWTVVGGGWLLWQRYIALEDRQQLLAIRKAHALRLAQQVGAEMPLMRCPAGCAGCARDHERELLERAVRHGHIPADRASRPGLDAAA